MRNLEAEVSGFHGRIYLITSFNFCLINIEDKLVNQPRTKFALGLVS